VALRAYSKQTQKKYADSIRTIADRTGWSTADFIPLTSVEDACNLFCLLDGTMTKGALHSAQQALVAAHATAGHPPPPFACHVWHTFWKGLLDGAPLEEERPINPMPVVVTKAVLEFWLNHPIDASQRNGIMGLLLFVTATRFSEVARAHRAHFIDNGPGQGITWNLAARQTKNSKHAATTIIPELDGGWRAADRLRGFLQIAPPVGPIFRPTARARGGSRWGEWDGASKSPLFKNSAFNEALGRALAVVLPTLRIELEVKHYTSHSLRKGRACHEFDQGATVQEVRNLLRHTSTTAVLAYVPQAAEAIRAERRKPQGKSIWKFHTNPRVAPK
jgi:hypothetical protein